MEHVVTTPLRQGGHTQPYQVPNPSWWSFAKGLINLPS